MPLPIAHGLIGASIVAASREDISLRKDLGALTAGAALAILPDLDLFFSAILGQGIQTHGSFSHSILFAAVAGAMIAMMRREFDVRGFLTFFLAGLSHGLLDAMTRRDFGGAELLWPLSTEKIRFGLIEYFEFYPNLVDPIGPTIERALDICTYEMMIFMPLFILTVWWRRAQDRVKVRPAVRPAIPRVVAHR